MNPTRTSSESCTANIRQRVIREQQRDVSETSRNKQFLSDLAVIKRQNENSC